MCVCVCVCVRACARECGSLCECLLHNTHFHTMTWSDIQNFSVLPKFALFIINNIYKSYLIFQNCFYKYQL